MHTQYCNRDTAPSAGQLLFLCPLSPGHSHNSATYPLTWALRQATRGVGVRGTLRNTLSACRRRRWAVSKGTDGQGPALRKKLQKSHCIGGYSTGQQQTEPKRPGSSHQQGHRTWLILARQGRDRLWVTAPSEVRGWAAGVCCILLFRAISRAECGPGPSPAWDSGRPSWQEATGPLLHLSWPPVVPLLAPLTCR